MGYQSKMICPRCSMAEITDTTNECQLCGYSPLGSVAVGQLPGDTLREVVQRTLGHRFVIEATLGRGRTSVVFLAQEVAGGRKVALKVVPLRSRLPAAQVEKFESHASRALGFRHSHLVTIYQHGIEPGFLWYSMEHVGGRSLAEVLRQSGPLDLDRCLRIVEQVSAALDYLHRRGVSHGALKPSNILLDAGGQWARVSDAGLNLALYPGAPTSAGAPLTLAAEYAAPEQFASRTAGPSADQYALAVVIFESLSGSLPFVGDSPDEIGRMHLGDAPPRLGDLRKDLPAYIPEAVQRALGKAPSERFPNIMDFAAILTGGWTAVAPDALDLSRRPTGSRSVIMFEPEQRAFPWRAIGFWAAAALLTAVAALVVWPRPPAERPKVWVEVPASPVREPASTWRSERSSRPSDPQPADQSRTSVARASTEAVRPVVVASPGSAPANVQPAAPAAEAGRVFVNAVPWGQLYIDGVLIGNTPRANVPVPAGTRALRVVREGFEPYERTITVTAGQELRVTDIVLTPRQP